MMDTCFQAARINNEGVSLITATESDESAAHIKFQRSLTLSREALRTLHDNNRPIPPAFSTNTVTDIPIEPIPTMMNAASPTSTHSSTAFVYTKALKVGIESSLPTNMTTLEASCCMSSLVLYNFALLYHMKGLTLQQQEQQTHRRNEDRIVVDDEEEEPIPSPSSRQQSVSSNVYYRKAISLYRIVLQTLVQTNAVLRGQQQQQEQDGDHNSLPLGPVHPNPSSLFLQVVSLNNLGTLLLQMQQFGGDNDGGNVGNANDNGRRSSSIQSSVRRIYLKLWDVLPTIFYERQQRDGTVAPAVVVQNNHSGGYDADMDIDMSDAIPAISYHGNDSHHQS